MSAPVVSARGVVRTYGHGAREVRVLDDVTVEVEPGELVALAGRSGSGKSTLCHLVAGLDRPSAGSVQVCGRPAHEVDDWATVGLLPQRLGLADELTVRENVLWPAWVRRTDADEELFESLGLAGLADRRATQTSLGEQQRAAIARALVLRPTLAVLDEPTGHQDDDHVAVVVATLARASRAGTAVLVATHDERVLEAATRVVRLAGGRVVA
jgi:ABC-type lipoprotein export system ATPase subunit